MGGIRPIAWVNLPQSGIDQEALPQTARVYHNKGVIIMAFKKKEDIAEVKTEEAQVETVVEKVEKPKTDTVPIVTVMDEKAVKVKPNFSGRKYVGDKWYYFVKDELIVVPKNVKDILVEQNALNAL